MVFIVYVKTHIVDVKTQRRGAEDAEVAEKNKYEFV
jgi:hypothetical protein